MHLSTITAVPAACRKRWSRIVRPKHAANDALRFPGWIVLAIASRTQPAFAPVRDTPKTSSTQDGVRWTTLGAFGQLIQQHCPCHSCGTPLCRPSSHHAVMKLSHFCFSFWALLQANRPAPSNRHVSKRIATSCHGGNHPTINGLIPQRLAAMR